jgi:hypothetical protein
MSRGSADHGVCGTRSRPFVSINDCLTVSDRRAARAAGLAGELPPGAADPALAAGTGGGEVPFSLAGRCQVLAQQLRQRMPSQRARSSPAGSSVALAVSLSRAVVRLAVS